MDKIIEKDDTDVLLNKNEGDIDEIFEDMLDERRSCGFSDIEIKSCVENEAAEKRRKRIKDIILGIRPALKQKQTFNVKTQPIIEESKYSLSEDSTSNFNGKNNKSGVMS